MSKLKKTLQNPNILFLLLLIVFAGFYYDGVLDKPPLSNHLWRQTDCISITQNYANGNSLLEPELHIQLADNNTSGKTAGEFPIIYYVIGKIWSVFGTSFLTYRVLYLILLVFGLYILYLSLKILFKDPFWAISLTLLLFTSPTLVVYGVSFLTDVPAFIFILIALYFTLRHSTEKKNSLLVYGMLFFALAGLIKVSALIAFVFLLFILILETLHIKTLKNKNVFPNIKVAWIGFSGALALIFSWYAYAHHYNEIHEFKYTFNNISPFWEIKEDQFDDTISNFKNFASIVFFSRPMLYSFLFVFLYNLSLWKKIPLFAYLSNIVVTAGGVIYFLLWASLMGNHDYYYVALLILFLGILIPFFWHLINNHATLLADSKIKYIFSAFLLFNFMYCLQVTQLKTRAQSGEFIFVGNHDFVKRQRYVNWDSRANHWSFYYARDYIKTIGINKEDKIICLPDPSFSVSLMLIDQKGWTNYLNYSKSEDIEFLIQKGAKYLILSKTEVLDQDFIQPFITNPIGSFKNLLFFKL